jgi:hypothetical protein
MANAYKILGQANLTTTSDTDIYTVPSATEAVISTLIVANIGTVATTFNLALRPNGETLADKHYIAQGVPIAANDSTTLTLGMTLDAADVVTAAAGTANALSFNIFGTEITA